MHPLLTIGVGAVRGRLAEELENGDNECCLREDDANEAPGLAMEGFLEVGLEHLQVELRRIDASGSAITSAIPSACSCVKPRF
jgi:hypothetical protein